MAYRLEQNGEIVIDGFEKGISQSAYTGIANMRNVNTSYYPGVAYVNYRRQAATMSTSGVTEWYAGAHSTNVSNNAGWIFTAPSTITMGNPVQHATSPAGLNYILDSNGNVWKQSAVNSSTFNLLENGDRIGNGSGGIAYWNNYIVVFGDGLVEFCGKGTNDSDITGANWNISGIQNNAVNMSVTAQQFQCTGSISMGATSATLASTNIYPTGGTSANWGYPTNSSATMIFSNGDTRTGTVTNGSSSITWTGGLSSNATSLVFITSTSLFTANTNGASIAVDQKIAFYGTPPSPLITGLVYYVTSAAVSGEGGYIFSVSATRGGTSISFSTLGTNCRGVLVIQNTLPTGNATGLSFSAALNPGDTSATITSYTGPDGLSYGKIWYFASGNYNLVDSNGNQILAAFNNGSSTVNFNAPIDVYATGTYSVNLLEPSVSSYRAYTSKVDGNLYFTNGSNMGSIQRSESNALFYPYDGDSFSVSYSFFELASGGNSGFDSIVDMTDLQSTMVVAGQTNIYTWDYVSAFTSAPVPVGEKISRIVNLMNQIYLTAGQKGNIYTSNGSYVQLLVKIPDQITGVIDPVWTYGGIMTHRSRVYFQVFAQDTSGNNILAGVFSLKVSPSLMGEIVEGIVMEAQNSYGLVPSSGATGAGILIDDEPSSNGQDSYYSAYSTGASSGGVDYNDTTLWQNFEPTIETDIIPIGTFLDKKTLGQIQFKLDRPMATGDQIKVYARASLSDAYTLVGTTTTTVLGDAYPSNLSQSQWIQFKITLSCAASGSSFIPLREMRVQTQ